MPAIGLKTGFSDRVSIKLEVNDDVIWLWPGVRLSFAGRGLPITVGVLLARGVRLPGALGARGWSCPLTVGLSFGQMLRLPRRNPMSTLRRSLIVRPRSGAGSGRALLRWSAPTTRPSVRVPASLRVIRRPRAPGAPSHATKPAAGPARGGDAANLGAAQGRGPRYFISRSSRTVKIDYDNPCPSSY